MKIIEVDTRQQKGKHDLKHAQLEALGYSLVRKKLDYGDYMLKGNEKISVDTKQNLDEIAGNGFSDIRRFMDEVRGACENKIKLYILIEHGGNIHSLDDVRRWKSTHGKVRGIKLAEKLRWIHTAYGTEFLFCEKSQTGRIIAEILEGNLTVKDR